MATRKVINKIIKDWQAYYIFWSGWADIDVDSALSTTSENPVQNKVITTELNKKANSNSLWTAASKDTWTSAWNVPLLNSNWKLDDSIIPAVAIVDTYAVTNKSDLLALSAQKWDVWIVSSESKSYILWGTGDPTVEANWLWLKTPSSVNNATISLTQAWESIDSFTVNQATNKTIALRGDIYLTQDEYDALPSSKETDWNNYHIIDDWYTPTVRETVYSGDEWVDYEITVWTTEPASWTASNIITIVKES